MNEQTVIVEVLAELERATRKFPTWPTDPLHALAVLGEEFGELTKAMLQFTYEPHKKVTRQDIRSEAIQTAAMALRLAMSLPLYDYAPAPQHKQTTRPGSEQSFNGSVTPWTRMTLTRFQMLTRNATRRARKEPTAAPAQAAMHECANRFATDTKPAIAVSETSAASVCATTGKTTMSNDVDAVPDCYDGDEYERFEPVCERCGGDGMDPWTDYLLPCPLCQWEQTP